MAFRQQLARKSVNVHQAWIADIKNNFMQECERSSESGRCSCQASYPRPEYACTDREVELVRQQLQGILMELGFPEGTVEKKVYHQRWHFIMQVTWSPEDATCSVPEPYPQTSRGTCATCPICQEHRPAVVLVPCGHVICRDCHRCQQLRQCPMCRGPITSATNGLFMD